MRFIPRTIQAFAIGRSTAVGAVAHSRQELYFQGNDSFVSGKLPDIELEEMEDALYTLRHVMKDAPDLEYAIAAYREHQAKGGNPYLISRLLLGMKGVACSDIPGTIRAISQPMRAVELKYAEKMLGHALYDASSPRLLPPWVKLNTDLPEVLDVLAQMTLALPFDIYLPDKAVILSALLQKSTNLQDLKEMTSRMQTLFKDVGRKEHGGNGELHHRLLSVIQHFGDLDRAELIKYLINQLMPAYISPKSEIFNSYDLSDTVSSSFPTPEIEISSGRKLEARDMKTALQSVSPELWTRLQEPGRYSSILGTLLYDCFNGIARKNLQPVSFGRYLLTLIDFTDDIDTVGMANLRANAWSLFKMDDTGEEKQFQKLKMLKNIYRVYHLAYPSPENTQLFSVFFAKILDKGKIEPEDYTKALAGFLNFNAILNESDRTQLLRTESPLRTLFLQTMAAFTAHEKTSGEKKFKPETFFPLLKRVVEEYKVFKAQGLDEKQVLFLLNHAMLYAEDGLNSCQGVDRNIEAFKTLLDRNAPQATMQKVMEEIPLLVSDETRQSILPLCLSYLEKSQKPIALIQFLMHFQVSTLSAEQLTQILEKSLQTLNQPSGGVLLNEINEVFEVCQQFKDSVPDMSKLILDLPGKWQATATVLKKFSALPAQLQKATAGLSPEEQQAFIRTNFELLSNLYHPNRFLNTLMLKRDRISPQTLFEIFNFIEYKGGFDTGITLLPELTAILGIYADMGKTQKPSEYRNYIDMATGALTSLFDYINDYQDGIDIQNVKGIVYNNWARAGSLGLSFTKWQYDAMKRWKGQGPSQKPALMEQSGLFAALPPREDDKTFHGGYFHHNPATGLTVEMRRAYIVISKPELGTLVIRNSSQVFGRDLLQSPAYYNDKAVATDLEHLLDPKDILPSKGFYTVFSKQLNRTSQQVKNHEKIKALLDAFDEAMEPYIAWKCGFKDGKPPEGFKEMLRSALLSTKSDGAMTPFGKKKNVKLAWVNRFGLPFAVRSLKVTDPNVQAELAFYINVLEKRTAVTNPGEYAAKIPNLLAFLQAGLSNHLELVLTE